MPPTESPDIVKDPVCGMTVDPATAISEERDGTTVYFCSNHCRKKLLSPFAAAEPEEKPHGNAMYTWMNILYEKTAEGSIEEVGARLEQAAQNHKFGVLGIIDLKAKMAGKGVEFGPECRIYEVCNPHSAKLVLEKNLSIATALPCRIALCRAAGNVTLSTLLPTELLSMFETPGLAEVAKDVENDLKAMMDEAAKA